MFKGNESKVAGCWTSETVWAFYLYLKKHLKKTLWKQQENKKKTINWNVIGTEPSSV